jgi:hypothetical protein
MRRGGAFDHLVQSQERVKGTFDRKAHPRELKKGDLVLMWNKRDEKPGKHGKFDSLWLGPYRIEDIVGLNSYIVWGVQGPFHDTLQDDTHGLPMYQLQIWGHCHIAHVILVLPLWFTQPLANQGGRWHSYRMTWQYHLSCSFTHFSLSN